MSGRRPFADAGTATSLVTALMTRTPVAPSTLFHRDCFPAAVDRLLLRCLEPDPEHRFASVSEIVEAIDEIFKYAAPSPFTGTTTLPGPGLRRRPSAAAVGRPAAGQRPSVAQLSATQPAAERRPSVAQLSAAQPSARQPSRVQPAVASAPVAPVVPVQPSRVQPSRVQPSRVQPSTQPSGPLAAVSRPSGARSVPPMFASLDDGEVTNVDVVPLFDMPWEPALDRSSDRLARTPYLDTPPDPPSFKAARGSTVSVSPYQPLAAPKRLAALKLAAWAAALLASGVGLGMVVASLC